MDTLTLFSKNLNQRSLTPRWPLTPCLLRSHVWLYPRIIVSKSHDNTSMYVDTVINFANYHIYIHFANYHIHAHTTYILRTEWVITYSLTELSSAETTKILYLSSNSDIRYYTVLPNGLTLWSWLVWVYTDPVCQLQGAWSYFSKFIFSLSFEESSLQKYKFQISVETVQPFGCTKQFCRLQLPISYCASLNMITIIRHIFMNIFQTEHFSAVKFAVGNEKKMSFLVIPKSPKVWKKVENIGLGSFNRLHVSLEPQ